MKHKQQSTRIERFRERNQTQGRKRWEVMVTDTERDALKAKLKAMRDGIPLQSGSEGNPS